VATSGQRQRVNAISAVNPRGAFWYAVYTGRFTAVRFIEFLGAFLRTRRRPVFLVVDGHPAHRAKDVTQYVQSLRGRLELHFLPGYAPELNPDEFVWNHLRQCGVSKKPLPSGTAWSTTSPASTTTTPWFAPFFIPQVQPILWPG
jgi:hypothetical protein